MDKKVSRRDFLKLGAIALSGAVINPFPPPQDEYRYASEDIGRITHSPSISVYQEPNDKSRIVFQKYRDELVNIYYHVAPSTGPAWNPLWYRVWGGYLHSMYVQRVKIRLNPPMSQIPARGHQLCEVTVPYTDSYIYSKYSGWERKLRLYYQTTHWVVGIETGPDGGAWYKVYDELEYDYFVPATALRPIPDDEVSPISPDIPAHQKRIEVSLQWQTLTAYEKDQAVFETKISSGIPSGKNPPEGTNTPAGTWNIFSKMPSKHMGDGNLTSDLKAYELAGVPWTSFFVESGVAFHGTYWHDNFGVPMSHGCVNMRTDDAKWLFRWTTPVWSPDDQMFWEKRGFGTTVVVI